MNTYHFALSNTPVAYGPANFLGLLCHPSQLRMHHPGIHGRGDTLLVLPCRASTTAQRRAPPYSSAGSTPLQLVPIGRSLTWGPSGWDCSGGSTHSRIIIGVRRPSFTPRVLTLTSWPQEVRCPTLISSRHGRSCMHPSTTLLPVVSALAPLQGRAAP